MSVSICIFYIMNISKSKYIYIIYYEYKLTSIIKRNNMEAQGS